MSNPENSSIELELTFLASRIPSEVQGVTPHHLLDIYIPEDLTAHSRLRIRQDNNHYEITKKLPIIANDASVQVEHTIHLDNNEFLALSRVSNKIIEKDRYKVVIDGHVAEVDVFMGALRGLVLIDFEFENSASKLAFSPPGVCLAEVTHEDFIAGGNLAGRTYTEIKDELAKFSYRPL